MSLFKINIVSEGVTMIIARHVLVFAAITVSAILGLVSCGKKCDASDSEKAFYNTDNCVVKGETAASVSGDYNIYVSSGFPVASGVGIISRWNKDGALIDIVRDYAGNPGFMPQAVVFQTLANKIKMLTLAFNGAIGEVDISDVDGSNSSLYFQNSAAMIVGTRRLVVTSDGGYLIARTAGVERFNSANKRVGNAARYLTGGGCTVTAGTSAAHIVISGYEYVVVSNGAATPNNKINLYNGTTGACISGVAPAGPATTMWPVDMVYVQEDSKLIVLYYPFTGSATNAQIWSFDVTATAVTNGILLFNDATGDLATISNAPVSQPSSITYYRAASERFVLIGTSFNSVIKLKYDGTSLIKTSLMPLIFQSSFIKSISNVVVLDN